MAKKSLKNKVEEESKIEFRGEKMKLSEAKTYLSKLEKGEINLDLNEAERNEAGGFMNSMKRCDIKEGIKEPYFKNYNEREYFSMILGMQINLQEKFDKENYCEKHGHNEVKDSAHITEGMGKTSAWAFCSNCGSMYERNPTPDEAKEWRDLLRTPMTI